MQGDTLEQDQLALPCHVQRTIDIQGITGSGMAIGGDLTPGRVSMAVTLFTAEGQALTAVLRYREVAMMLKLIEDFGEKVALAFPIDGPPN